MPGRRDIIAAGVRILVIAPLLKQYIISALIIFPHDPDMNRSVQCAFTMCHTAFFYYACFTSILI